MTLEWSPRKSSCFHQICRISGLSSRVAAHPPSQSPQGSAVRSKGPLLWCGSLLVSSRELQAALTAGRGPPDLGGGEHPKALPATPSPKCPPCQGAKRSQPLASSGQLLLELPAENQTPHPLGDSPELNRCPISLHTPPAPHPCPAEPQAVSPILSPGTGASCASLQQRGPKGKAGHGGTMARSRQCPEKDRLFPSLPSSWAPTCP